jgi:DNA-binding transcriptional ArsR family regulator
MNKADLIIHPVRLRILRVLDGEALTTQELAERLGDVPTSSLYRHLKLLLDGRLVEVADLRLVRGIQEKTYRLAQTAVLRPADVALLTADDHVHYFTTYVLTLLHDFAAYVTQTEAERGSIDMLADRVGYREVSFYATTQELDEAFGAVNAALRPLLQHEAGNGRRRYKLATVLHPQGANYG